MQEILRAGLIRLTNPGERIDLHVVEVGLVSKQSLSVSGAGLGGVRLGDPKGLSGHFLDAVDLARD